MIDIKNRSREVRIYQYPREVSAGPVRPQVLDVARGRHNAKTGEVVVAPAQITVGGVLTLAPKQTLKGLPDALLSHPSLKRDIDARAVSVKQYQSPTAKPSVAKTEHTHKPAPKKSSRKRRGSKE